MSIRWTIVSLSEVVERVGLKNKDLLDRVLTVSAIRGLVVQETYFSKRVASSNLANYLVIKPGTFVYNKSYSEAAPFGVAISNSSPEPGVVSPLYFAFKPKRGAIDQSFLEYVLNSSNFHIQLAQFIKQGGRAHGGINVSTTDYFSLKIPQPDLAEQKRIVDVVSSVDAYIDALQQQADTARTARNAVLYELLSAGGDDWTQTTIGKEALINPKQSALAKDAPFIPMDAVKVGKRFVDYFEPRGERSGARAKSGDVLFARITPCLENGKVAQIQDGVGACGGSTEFIVVRGTETINSDFIYFWATLERTRDLAAGLMTGTTGRQRLSANDLGEIALELPPIDEQKRIVEIVSSIDEMIQSTEQAVLEAKNLRSGLLSDLLSGEHKIPESYDRFLKAA